MFFRINIHSPKKVKISLFTPLKKGMEEGAKKS